MASQRYYSPRLDRELITRLYHAAKARRVPMTVLASQFVKQGLIQAEDIYSPPERLNIREEPNPGR